MTQTELTTAFEVDNARNEETDSLPQTFVWTGPFQRLLTEKNHVILGARGSGKTAIAKMLSHPYLARSQEPMAMKLIAQREYIGTFISTDSNWVGVLRNKRWGADRDEAFFQWRLNIKSCSALLTTVKSCIQTYITDGNQRIGIEQTIVKKVAELLNMASGLQTIDQLIDALEDFEFEKLKRLNVDAEAIEDRDVFDLELFNPFRQIIRVTSKSLGFTDKTKYLICIDEAEYLSESHHRILNSVMRSASQNIYLKITTLPYAHKSVDTNLGDVDVARRDDFDYVYIDTLFSTSDAPQQKQQALQLANEIFEKRLAKVGITGTGISLDYFLGRTEILTNSPDRLNHETIMRLVNRHCNQRTIARAESLMNTKKFNDEIARKLGGLLELRESVAQQKGRVKSEIFSGVDMFVVCTDGNPRQMISLTNQLVLRGATIQDTGFTPLGRAAQNEAFDSVAIRTLHRARADSVDGLSLHDTISLIGKEFRRRTHDLKLGSDSYGTISIGPGLPKLWELVQEAVNLGLLYPIVSAKFPDELPLNGGRFRLAYSLAPIFKLLPRKGKSVSFRSLFASKSTSRTFISDDNFQLVMEFLDEDEK